MPDLLKDIYNDAFFATYTEVLQIVLGDFDSKKWMSFNRSVEWKRMELKQRMTCLTQNTDKVLPKAWENKMYAIITIINELKSKGVKDQNLPYIFLCDLMSKYCELRLEESFSYIEKMTAFCSFEFAGRKLFVLYPDVMMAQMMHWTQHPNPNVRRYASEGCRPLLPWGLRLNHLVKNPSPIFPILEKLLHDESEYVRKSVANNINDISKHHQDKVLDFAAKWWGTSPNINKLLKHGIRTLLKQGNQRALNLIGIKPNASITTTNLTLDATIVTPEKALKFEFEIISQESKPVEARIEYYIWFVKANNSLSKKIFHITNKTLYPNTTYRISRQHKFHDLTTRKHYVGEHKITLVVNGLEKDFQAFYLKK